MTGEGGCVGGHQLRYAGRTNEPHHSCERPYWLGCLCGYRIASRCGASARSRCGPCSESYRRRVRRVFQSGWTDRPTDRVLLLTVTAPGDREHFLRDGSPCPCTPEGGMSVAESNSDASKRFNRLMQQIRRRYGKASQYAKAAEIQDGKRRRDHVGRGALHFHILLRVERPDLMLRDYRASDPECPLRVMVERYGFGHSMDLQVVEVTTASYCAKYVSKSADDRSDMPWLDRQTGVVVSGNGRYRTWTASRSWGLTMKAVRAAQAAWWQAGQASGGETPAAGRQAGAGVAAEGGPLDPNTMSYTSAVFASRLIGLSRMAKWVPEG
jgi:hypothetical protein